MIPLGSQYSRYSTKFFTIISQNLNVSQPYVDSGRFLAYSNLEVVIFQAYGVSLDTCIISIQVIHQGCPGADF